jgi:hypothetical protein
MNTFKTVEKIATYAMPTMFTKYSDVEILPQIFDFMKQPLVLGAMIGAVKCKKPAVLGINDLLYEAFGDRISTDRAKMAVGAIAKYLLEELGYTIEKEKCTISSFIGQSMFITGATYCRK